MTKKGRIRKSQAEGRFIEEPLRYAKNETVKWIGKGESVDLEATDPVTLSHWEWKWLTGHILKYNADIQRNTGKSRVINMVQLDIDTLRDSLIDDIETAAFGDGTGDSNKAIQGLQSLIADAPATGTVGGLNRANRAWWRNQYTDMSGEGVATYLIDRMRTMYNDCSKWGDGGQRFPDLIVSDQTSYETYEDECLSIGRIQLPSGGVADLGFGDLAFKGQPMTWAPSCPTQTIYFLNSNVMTFYTNPRQWLTLGDFKDIYDQPEDYVKHSMSMCALVISNARKLGVLFDVGA